MADTLRFGRPGGIGTTTVTRLSGKLGGTPEGRPTHIGDKEDADVQRSLKRESSSAALLADHGYRIKQNPTPVEVAEARRTYGDTGDSAARPDYLIEGRVFDCYSPAANKPVRGVWFEATKKVTKGQTQRVVVNLQDWQGDLVALRHQFRDWPTSDLKELKVITSEGDVVQFIPDEANDGDSGNGP